MNFLFLFHPTKIGQNGKKARQSQAKEPGVFNWLKYKAKEPGFFRTVNTRQKSPVEKQLNREQAKEPGILYVNSYVMIHMQ